MKMIDSIAVMTEETGIGTEDMMTTGEIEIGEIKGEMREIEEMTEIGEMIEIEETTGTGVSEIVPEEVIMNQDLRMSLGLPGM